MVTYSLHYRVYILLFVSLFYIQIVVAQKISLDTTSIIELHEVTLEYSKGQKFLLNIDEKLKKQDFENLSPIESISIINKVPGVYALSGALNTNRITIRGVGARTPFGTDKLRLYLDGIPVTNGTGVSTIETFDVENMSSINIIKGPKGTAFGANLGGAILLNTDYPMDEGIKLSNSFSVGSFNQLKNNLNFSYSDKKKYISLSYDHLEHDGYRENSNFERDGLLLNTKFKLNNKNTAGFLINYIDYHAQIPSSLGESDFYETPEMAATNWLDAKGFESNKYVLTGIHFKRFISENLYLKSSAFYSYLDHYEPRPFNILDEFTHGFGGRLMLLKTDHSNGKSAFTYLFGAEVYRDEYNWKTYDNLYLNNDGNGSLEGDILSRNKEIRNQVNAFGSVKWKFFERLWVEMGLALNTTSYDFKDQFNVGFNNKNASHSFNTILLPSISSSYRFSEHKKIFINASRGFSNPGLEETLTPDGLINPDIKREVGDSFELGLDLSFFKNTFHIKSAIYNMKIKNLLVAERVGEDQYIGRNAGKTKHQGIELALQYNIPIFPRAIISPYINYTLNDHHFIDFVDSDNDFSGNELTGVPKNRINSGFEFSHTMGWFWNTEVNYVDPIPLKDDNSYYSKSYTIWNMRLGIRKKISKHIGGALFFGANNLSDKLYARSVLINAKGFGGREPRFFYPGDERNYYLNIKLNYSL